MAANSSGAAASHSSEARSPRQQQGDDENRQRAGQPAHGAARLGQGLVESAAFGCAPAVRGGAGGAIHRGLRHAREPSAPGSWRALARLRSSIRLLLEQG